MNKYGPLFIATLLVNLSFQALVYDHNNLGQVYQLSLPDTTTKALQYEVTSIAVDCEFRWTSISSK